MSEPGRQRWEPRDPYQPPSREPMSPWAAPSEAYGRPQRSGPNGFAITSLTTGVIGLFLFNVVLGPCAIVFGVLGLNRAKQGSSGRGMAIAGIALGIFDVVIWLILVIAITRRLGYTV